MKINDSANQRTAVLQCGFEDEILDRRDAYDPGWTFSCCMSISDEDEAKPLGVLPSFGGGVFEDEILDRPLLADMFTMCCCLSGGLTPDGDIKHRLPLARLESFDARAVEVEVLDRPMSAGHCGYTVNWPAPRRDHDDAAGAGGTPQVAIPGADAMVDTMLLAGGSLLDEVAPSTRAF